MPGYSAILNKGYAEGYLSGGSSYNVNGAIAFDNANQYVDMAPLISQVSSLRAFTVSVWVHADDFSSGTQHITQIYDSVSGERFAMRFNSNGGVEIQYVDGGVQWRYVTSDKPVDDRWNHIAIAFDGVNECKVYLDGILAAGSYTISLDKTLSFDSMTAPDEWELGRRPNDDGFNLYGAMANFQIYDDELDPLDIVDIFNNELPKNEESRSGQVVNLRLGSELDFDSYTEYGKGYRINSRSQNNYINATAGLSAISGHTSGSVSFWCRMDDATPSTAQMLWSVGDTSTTTRICCFMQSNGRLRFQAFNGANRWVLDVNAAFSDNTKHHVVIVQDGIKPKIYIDNVEVSLIDAVVTDTTEWFADYGVLDNITLGCYDINNAGPALYADAVIFGFLVSSTVLNTEQISTLYNGGVVFDASGTPGAALYYPGVGDTYDGSNWTIVDVIGGNDATSVRMNEIHQRVATADNTDIILEETVTATSITFEGSDGTSLATTDFTENTLPTIVYDGNSIPTLSASYLEDGFEAEYGLLSEGTYRYIAGQVSGKTVQNMVEWFPTELAAYIKGNKNAYYFIHEIRNELVLSGTSAETTRDRILNLAALVKSVNSNCKVVLIQASASVTTGGVLPETDIPVVNAYFDSPQANIDLVIDLYNHSGAGGDFSDFTSGWFDPDKIHPSDPTGRQEIGDFIPAQFKIEYPTL